MAIGDEYLRSMQQFMAVGELSQAIGEMAEAVRAVRMSDAFFEMREILRGMPPVSLTPPTVGISTQVLDSVRRQLKEGMGLTLSEDVRRSLLESVALNTAMLRDLQLPSSFASVHRLTSSIPPDVLELMRSSRWEADSEDVERPAIALSPEAIAALSRGVSPLLSDERDPEWVEQEGPLLLAGLAEVVEAATPVLADDLANARTPEDRIQAFVRWWRSLPPVVQLIFALVLQWATLGLSAEYLKDHGMLPGLTEGTEGGST